MGNLVSREINCKEVCDKCKTKETITLEGKLNKEFQKIGEKAKKKAGELGEKAKEKAGEVLRASKKAGKVALRAGEVAGQLAERFAFAILPGGGGGADGQHNVLASILGLTVVFASSLLQ